MRFGRAGGGGRGIRVRIEDGSGGGGGTGSGHDGEGAKERTGTFIRPLVTLVGSPGGGLVLVLLCAGSLGRRVARSCASGGMKERARLAPADELWSAHVDVATAVAPAPCK